MKLHFAIAISCLAVATTAQVDDYWCKCTGGSGADIKAVTSSCCTNGVTDSEAVGFLTGVFSDDHDDCTVQGVEPLARVSNAFANCCRDDAGTTLDGAQCNLV
ncbi:hypothetical protein NX059_011494 [Plenodomus lindquistii]|nr:hypothetical protein NX059_011494 [Plenodomus lindquistii]